MTAVFALCGCKKDQLPDYYMVRVCVPDSQCTDGMRNSTCARCSVCLGWRSLKHALDYTKRDMTKPIAWVGTFNHVTQTYF